MHGKIIYYLCFLKNILPSLNNAEITYKSNNAIEHIEIAKKCLVDYVFVL